MKIITSLGETLEVEGVELFLDFKCRTDFLNESLEITLFLHGGDLWKHLENIIKDIKRKDGADEFIGNINESNVNNFLEIKYFVENTGDYQDYVAPVKLCLESLKDLTANDFKDFLTIIHENTSFSFERMPFNDMINLLKMFISEKTSVLSESERLYEKIQYGT